MTATAHPHLDTATSAPRPLEAGPQIGPEAPDTPTPRPAERKRKGAPRAQRGRARRASFGSTRQLPSGRWQARYLDSDGTRRTGPRTFATARDAEDWLATSRADLLRGTYHSPHLGAVALGDYATEYLASRVDLAPRTLVTYRDLLARWLLRELTHPGNGRRVTIGHVQLRELSPATVREWQAAALADAQRTAQARAEAGDEHRRRRARHAAREWARASGIPVAATGRLPQPVLEAWRAAGEPGAATLDLPPTAPAADAGRTQVAQAYRLLRSVLAVAVRDGLIPANPCTLPGAGQTQARERVPATPAEVAAIATHMPPRFAAAVHVAAWSGLRAGELFALTRADVTLPPAEHDDQPGTLRVQRALVALPGQPIRFGPPKTAASRRTVHLPPPVVAILREHLRHHVPPGPDALVFGREDGTPLPSGRRSTLFRNACAHVGRHDLRWHDLRHTGATLAAQAGASLRELQARLGHSTVAAAMRYQHASAERDRELATRMGALVAPAPAPEPLRLVR